MANIWEPFKEEFFRIIVYSSSWIFSFSSLTSWIKVVSGDKLSLNIISEYSVLSMESGVSDVKRVSKTTSLLSSFSSISSGNIVLFIEISDLQTNLI